MTAAPFITLHDGSQIPQLGLGVWQVSDAQAGPALAAAFEAGYRAIDTAAAYNNEDSIGKAVKASGLPRDKLFITTKLWNDAHGYDATLKAFDASLKKLQLDYVDLYLIHWPVPKQKLFIESWRAFAKLKEDGRVKSIGVSNFNIPHLQTLIDETGIAPTVNQIELHPQMQQQELRQFHKEHSIATESWSPLGQGTILQDATIGAIAKKHRKTPAQVIIRWHLDNGLIVIPKSVTPSRIKENFAVFDFRLDNDDLGQIGRLDKKHRIGPDPETFG
jgi:2,5-diketo-D-gluconate reductase A